jgi:hypothetical protein
LISDGNRHAIGDLDEPREAVDRVKAYQDFQPDEFNRRELNRRLRAFAGVEVAVTKTGLSYCGEPRCTKGNHTLLVSLVRSG